MIEEIVREHLKTILDVPVLMEEENKEKLKQLQEKYIQLLQDEEMKQYFDYEIKFNVMVTDVNKIIAEAIKDVL